MQFCDTELMWDFRKYRTFAVLGLFLFSAIAIGYFVPVTIGKAAAANTFGNATGDAWWVWVFYLVFNGYVAGLFPLLIGGFISTDSIASEFQLGTIVPLLSQPVRRIEVYLGKLLEKLLLMLAISMAFTVVSYLAAEGSIGNQINFVEWFPWVTLTALGAFMEFVALAFLLGSFMRSGSMLPWILTGIFFGVIIAVGILKMEIGIQMWQLALPIVNVQQFVYVVVNYIQSPSGNIVLYATLGRNQTITVTLVSALKYVLTGLAINIIVPLVLGYFIFRRAEVRE